MIELAEQRIPNGIYNDISFHGRKIPSDLIAVKDNKFCGFIRKGGNHFYLLIVKADNKLESERQIKNEFLDVVCDNLIFESMPESAKRIADCEDFADWLAGD